MLPGIFYSLRTVKNFQMTVTFMYDFRSLSNYLPTIFYSSILYISLPRLGYFLQKKDA